MTTYYAVMKKNYEYNDETYDSNDGGNNVKAYSTKEGARAEALRLSIEEIRSGNMMMAWDRYETFRNPSEEFKILMGKYGLSITEIIDSDWREVSDLSDKAINMTDDEISLILREMGSYNTDAFYFVEEVELVE